MAAYRRVYDSRHLQADHQEPGSAPEPYARQSSMGHLYLFTDLCVVQVGQHMSPSEVPLPVRDRDVGGCLQASPPPTS